MPLIKCPDCGKDVSDAAPSCPNCGRPTSVQPPASRGTAPAKKKKTSPLAWGCLIVLLGILALIVGAGLMVDRSTSDHVRSPELSGQPTAPQLELESFRVYKEYDYSFVEGQVKNISGQPLKNVTAVASFYDSKGGFVTSADALIDYNPILPGQTSPFKAITTDNPAIAKAGVDFKDLLGGAIPFRQAVKGPARRK